MALRKIPRAQVADDGAALRDTPFPTVLMIGDEPVTVTLGEMPRRESHATTCQCEACAAARLSELKVRFQPG
jgi:hypothetical protein